MLQLGHADSYERTYSCANDFAIACALAGVPEATHEDHELAQQLQAEDESRERQQQQDHELAQQLRDHDLAVQLHQQEQAQLGGHAPQRRSKKRQQRRLDKRLRSLLSTLNFTKVIPRLNPSFQPNASYVSEDRQRLLLRLDMYALQERTVVGDGNCQFRSLSDQLWFDQQLHGRVREAVVAQLLAHPARYKDYVTTDYEQYIESMSRSSTWGDHITLQAAADAYQCRICIVSSFLDNCVISISPTQEEASHVPQEEQHTLLQQAGQQLMQERLQGSSVASERTLWLSFWAEVHYNSLAPKAPSGPSDTESDGTSSSSTSTSSSADSSDEDEAASSRQGQGMSSRLKQAATHMVPSMLRR